MEKRPGRASLFALLSFLLPLLFTLSVNPDSTARRRLMTERSERMSEEAEKHPD